MLALRQAGLSAGLPVIPSSFLCLIMSTFTQDLAYQHFLKLLQSNAPEAIAAVQKVRAIYDNRELILSQIRTLKGNHAADPAVIAARNILKNFTAEMTILAKDLPQTADAIGHAWQTDNLGVFNSLVMALDVSLKRERFIMEYIGRIVVKIASV